jgi:hypothetical protein
LHHDRGGENEKGDADQPDRSFLSEYPGRFIPEGHAPENRTGGQDLKIAVAAKSEQDDTARRDAAGNGDSPLRNIVCQGNGDKNDAETAIGSHRHDTGGSE